MNSSTALYTSTGIVAAVSLPVTSTIHLSGPRLNLSQHQYLATRLPQAFNILLAIQEAVSDGLTLDDADWLMEKIRAMLCNGLHFRRVLHDLAQLDYPDQRVSYYGPGYFDDPFTGDDSGHDYRDMMGRMERKDAKGPDPEKAP